MSSFNKRMSKRKESKVTLKTHKKQVDSSSQMVNQGGSTASLPVRSKNVKM